MAEGWKRGSSGTGGRSAENFTTSSDGRSLYYPALGTEGIDEQSLVEDFSSSLKVVGSYSEDGDKDFNNDRSYISFLQTDFLPDPFHKQKLVHLDLNVGTKEGKNFTGSDKQGFENVLAWIINNKTLFHDELISKEPGDLGGRFVMMKNVLSYTAKTPYLKNLELDICAVSLNGVIYVKRKDVSTDEQRKQTQIGLWCHRFEQYMTRASEEVGCNEDFRIVMSGSLGPHKLLYSAATDCADPELYVEDFSDMSAFVALKCSKEYPPDLKFLEAKLYMMFHYLHCLLGGVPRMIVGYRSEEGIISKLRLLDLPEMVQRGKNYWNPVNCLACVSSFLSFIKSNVESDPGAIFCFKKEPRRPVIVCTKTSDAEGFLPDWFLGDIIETCSEKKED